VVGLTAGGTAAFYTFTTYMQTFVKQTVGLTDLTTTTMSSRLADLRRLLQPIYGAISDRIGRKPLLIFFGVAGTLLTVPILTTLQGHEIALDRLPADLRRLDLRGRLHLDQCGGEGRAVPDLDPRDRRRACPMR
jgi:hypothetical protein